MTKWSLSVALAFLVASAPLSAATVSELQKAANAGDAKAQYELGVKYEYGQGVDQNYGKAAEWTRKSAEQGYADGQYNYGLMLEYGQGVGKNLAEADAWYARAAEQGMKGAVQARAMLARRRRVPARLSASGETASSFGGEASAEAGPQGINPSAQGQSRGMGSSARRDRQRLLDRGTSDRPDRR